MPISLPQLKNLLTSAFPFAEISVRDLVGDQDHYEISVHCSSFQGLSPVQQHQKVYAALKNYNIHALSIKTSIKEVF